jgi:DNA invertase Pin-like site-specific DNA recombinase
MGDKTMRFALYARVSTVDKGQDVELQLKNLRSYAKARGWEIFDEYKDVGLSGSTGYLLVPYGSNKKPELSRLMEDARKRRIDGILVWKLDRFGRSLRSLVTTLEELRDLGVQFVSYTENLDFTTPGGRAMANLIGVFAEFERDLIRERVRAGMLNAKSKGIRLGRRPLIDKYFLKEVADMSGKGMSLREIARDLKISKSLVHKALKISRQQTLDNQGAADTKTESH